MYCQYWITSKVNKAFGTEHTVLSRIRSKQKYPHDTYIYTELTVGTGLSCRGFHTSGHWLRISSHPPNCRIALSRKRSYHSKRPGWLLVPGLWQLARSRTTRYSEFMRFIADPVSHHRPYMPFDTALLQGHAVRCSHRATFGRVERTCSAAAGSRPYCSQWFCPTV